MLFEAVGKSGSGLNVKADRFKSRTLRRWKVLALVCAITFTSCGESFKKGTLRQGQEAGTFEIPAKVDIILAQDDTGSIAEAFNVINFQFPRFLEKLENTGWNYNFAVTPLTTQRSLLEVLPSKFDGNWFPLGLWESPFPGANPNDPKNHVDPNFFRTQSNYSRFLKPNEITNSKRAAEPGFDTIDKFIHNTALKSARFLRQDALLVVIVLSNGEDDSGVTYCLRIDGRLVPCEKIGQPGTLESSFQQYKNSFKTVQAKGLSADFRMFSVVSWAASTQQNCLGSNPRYGERYVRMAYETSGDTFDICNQPIWDSLVGIDQHLLAERKSYGVGLLVADQEPDPSTIRVVKYPGGDKSNPVEIPNDPINGWTYRGLDTDFQIFHPIQLNQVTGHLVDLHGEAILWGTDLADLLFEPKAGQTSTGN